MERFRQLSKQEITRYKSLLEERYAELTRFLPHRENITVARMPDAVDEAVLAAEREIEIRTLDDGSSLLRKVSAALRRIESNHYGTCTGCGERISPKRLDALPWTSLCIKCQQEQEQQAHDHRELVDAA